MTYQMGDLVFSQAWQTWCIVSYRVDQESVVLTAAYPHQDKKKAVHETDLISVDEFGKMCHNRYKAKGEGQV